MLPTHLDPVLYRIGSLFLFRDVEKSGRSDHLWPRYELFDHSFFLDGTASARSVQESAENEPDYAGTNIIDPGNSHHQNALHGSCQV